MLHTCLMFPISFFFHTKKKLPLKTAQSMFCTPLLVTQPLNKPTTKENPSMCEEPFCPYSTLRIIPTLATKDLLNVQPLPLCRLLFPRYSTHEVLLNPSPKDSQESAMQQLVCNTQKNAMTMKDMCPDKHRKKTWAVIRRYSDVLMPNYPFVGFFEQYCGMRW